jgi:hypothetical protein
MAEMMYPRYTIEHLHSTEAELSLRTSHLRNRTIFTVIERSRKGMIYRSVLVRILMASAMTAVSAAYANAQQFQAIFSGLNEVPPILSQGQATLKMTLNTQLQSLTYTLTYSGLSSPIFQSAIHFARARDVGGIIVFLCSNGGNPPGTPVCSGTSGTVSGTLTPASVIGPAPQGIAPANFAGLATALSSQSSYASIQTANFPTGEIRGEIIPCPSSGCP